MFHLTDHPFVMLAVSFAVFWLAAVIGCCLNKGPRKQRETDLEDFKFVLGGILTLLGLIIGFSFSMAVARYDQRKHYEEEEANAIGTEYVRADLLPPAVAANVRSLLTSYLDRRIGNYKSRDIRIDAETARLQGRMWSAVSAPGLAQPTPITALAVSGMNDVLNSLGYTQAAWRDRVPFEAWALLVIISIVCNLMIGYGAEGRSSFLLLILPAILAISLFLIADIDSPRGGLIRIHPLNLESLAESLEPSKNP